MGQSVAGHTVDEGPPVGADPIGAIPAIADPLDVTLPAHGVPPARGDGQADDLLSELAGAEIDRMLAAADVEPVAVAVPLPPSPVVVTHLGAVPEPAPATVPTTESAIAAALMPEPPVAAPAPAPAPPPLSPEVAATPPTAEDLDAVLSSAAAEQPAKPAPPAEAHTEGPALDLGDPLPRRSWLLRPLALLSAPLDGYPDRVRETVGKVAVVTLVNAMAVITFVLIFRRHG